MTKFLTLFLLLLAVPAQAHMHHEGAAQPAAPVVNGAAVGGPFALVDQNGKAVTEKSWPGKYKLVFFGYTHCPDICPVVMQKISAVMDKFDPKGEKIAPLFITVDPARDTPARLKLFIEASYNPVISGLTGTEAQIAAALKAYKVYAARKPGQGKDDYVDYLADHSAYIYLMAPDDKLIDVFGSDVEGAAILDKVKQSVK